jgi:hypothetical protein
VTGNSLDDCENFLPSPRFELRTVQPILRGNTAHTTSAPCGVCLKNYGRVLTTVKVERLDTKGR